MDGSGSLTLERETLHISDDTGRMALIDTRTTGSGTEPPQLMRYQYSNHLGSAALELDDIGAIISYEEYYPYGSTSFRIGRSGAEVSLKRYRYTGKERDEESGLYYHGARYYIPWLVRWTACDPINSEWYNLQQVNTNGNNGRDIFDLTPSPYEYCYANPIRFTDSTGEQPNPLQQAWSEGEREWNNFKGSIKRSWDGSTEAIKSSPQAAAQAAGKAVIKAIQIKTNIEDYTQNGGNRTIKGKSESTGKNGVIRDTNPEDAARNNIYAHADSRFVVDESNAKGFKNYEIAVVAMLLNNFVSGNGPENYSFPENGVISSKFISNQSAILHEALGKYLEKKNNISMPAGFGIGDLVLDRSSQGTLSNIVGFTGSAWINITNDEQRKGISIQITNITSLTSGSLGKEIDFTKTGWPNSTMREKGETIPYSNISQTFNLFIPFGSGTNKYSKIEDTYYFNIKTNWNNPNKQ